MYPTVQFKGTVLVQECSVYISFPSCMQLYWYEETESTMSYEDSWFAWDIISAMLVYSNNRVVITFFCCVHQHGRRTLCQFECKPRIELSCKSVHP